MRRLSAQKRGGREAWIKRVRITSFVVRIIRLALLSWEEVYGQRHAQLNTPRKKERTGGGVIELPPVVTLDDLNGEAELSGHPGKEVKEGGKGLRLGAQRNSPRVVRKIINHHQIIFITRHAEYRRCPQITVNKIKSTRNMRRRRRKRKSDMTT